MASRAKVAGMYAIIAVATLAAWGLALTAFATRPLLLGTALIAFGFGLRHAVDADHISAIDNVTRKLMQEGKRPAAVGFFFSLGHSTIVIALTAAIAVGSNVVHASMPQLERLGGLFGTLVSAFFLFAIAGVNLAVFLGVYDVFRRVCQGERYDDASMNVKLAERGLIGRFFQPLMKFVGESWHMYPIGVLFGLGFDTATEVGVLGIAAIQGGNGLPVYDILIFPLLFTVGMSLVDTTDGVLMLGAYGWAYVRPIRKLFYNMTITAVSVAVALFVGGVEVAGIVGDELHLSGGLWNALSSLNGNFGALGIGIVAVFATSWLISAVIYRWRGYDDIQAA